MAAKGGGAWKVAYADFVTAMMALFLVMWLCAQDLKVRQSVAKYFMDPSGASNKSGRTGSVIENPRGGSVPNAESVALGQGRQSYTQNQNSPATKAVNDWLRGDRKASDYWQRQAQECRKTARLSRDVLENLCTIDEAATFQLAKQLHDKLSRELPTGADGVYRDLLLGTLSEVNWTQLAKDLLTRE
jgi:flagellar motor protein MotB